MSLPSVLLIATTLVPLQNVSDSRRAGTGSPGTSEKDPLFQPQLGKCFSVVEMSNDGSFRLPGDRGKDEDLLSFHG